MAEKTPAELIRDGWPGLIGKTTPDEVNDIHKHLLNVKAELALAESGNQALSEADRQMAIEGYRNTLFIIACHLLPYGRLEVVDDIIENFEFASVRSRALITLTRLLFPVPEHFDTERTYQGYYKIFSAWFQENRHHLEWSETLGRYQFKDAEQ